MNKVDLLRMSLSSLWRRKLRTVLTVLGVVVGTASIVVMISLGLGLNKSSMEQIEQYGGLTLRCFPSLPWQSRVYGKVISISGV